MKKYIVVKSRKTEFTIPVKVKKGEMVICKEKSDSTGDWAGWILCETLNNEGWIPYQIIDEENSTIKEDYNAVEFDLIEDEILIYEKELNGWIWCYKEGNSNEKAFCNMIKMAEKMIETKFCEIITNNFENL